MAGRGGQGPLSRQPAGSPRSPAHRSPAVPPPPGSARPARTGAPWPVVAVALAAALVSLAVALGALLLGERSADRAERAERARAGALDAARTRTLALTSYDHRSLDADFAAVLETATGEFRQDYVGTTGRLREAFARSRAVAEAQVVAAGLESADLDGDGPDRAVAVVAVDQVIRTTGAAARTERNRLRMVLVRPDGTWLVERVQRL